MTQEEVISAQIEVSSVDEFKELRNLLRLQGVSDEKILATFKSLKKMQKEGLSEDMEKRAEEKVQKLTDKYYSKVEELINTKEKDIMTI